MNLSDYDLQTIYRKLDDLEQRLKQLEKDTYKNLFHGAEVFRVNKTLCLWDSIKPEDRMKSVGMSCPCPKCSPYCKVEYQ